MNENENRTVHGNADNHFFCRRKAALSRSIALHLQCEHPKSGDDHSDASERNGWHGRKRGSTWLGRRGGGGRVVVRDGAVQADCIRLEVCKALQSALVSIHAEYHACTAVRRWVSLPAVNLNRSNG